MKPITVWERFDRETGRFEHNHIEDGHSRDTKPAAKTPEQAQAWRGAQWASSHAYLDNDGVIVNYVGGTIKPSGELSVVVQRAGA